MAREIGVNVGRDLRDAFVPREPRGDRYIDGLALGCGFRFSLALLAHLVIEQRLVESLVRIEVFRFGALRGGWLRCFRRFEGGGLRS
jgi:hypothetical protein